LDTIVRGLDEIGRRFAATDGTAAPNQASGSPMPKSERRLKGKWRIVEAEMFDRGYLNLAGPAFIELDGEGGGEFAWGALTATLHCGVTPRGVDFTWSGSDEMDEASGEGWADLEEDGSMTGEISYSNGDETSFKARPW
jgi:hypothetical protein